MRLRKLIIALLIGLVFFAIVAVAALFFVDPTVFRGQLEERASAAFGRKFQINGPISLERSLRPKIVIEGATIGNPDWASGKHFATAQKLGIRVELLPLLRGDLKILDILFTGVEVFVEVGPDGVNNYTFGNGGDREEPGVLPPIDHLNIQDAIISYRLADASISRYEIAKAQLWNIPGQPERIKAEGSFRGMPFSLLLDADTPAELSGPQNPWSVKLDLKGPDMSLTIDGRMAKAFSWDKCDYRITMSGKQADSLESLFDLELPTTGPFEISAAVNTAEGLYTLTDLAALLHGPSGTPDLKITNGEGSGGRDDPLYIELQGKYGDAPLEFAFKSERSFKVISQTTPLPMEARLYIADTKIDVRGTITPATAAESLELDVQLQGKTLETLAQLLDTELPKTGPYRFSFHTQFVEESYKVTNLEGTIRGTDLWKSIQIARGNVSANKSGFVKASVDANLDNVPLSLSFQGGPETAGKSSTTDWPVQLKASVPGTVVNGDGSIVTTKDRSKLQIATRVKGNRLDTLGSLVGVSLPRMGTYDLSAFASSGAGVHELRDLRLQMGANHVTGSIRWEEKSPRPLLTGKLSSDRITLTELWDTASEPSSKTRQDGLLDRPIKLDWLKDFDAKLEFDVNRVAGSPITVEKVSSEVTVANASLSAPFRGEVAGAPIEGQIRLTQPRNLPSVSLTAAIGRIDAGQTLKQLKLPKMIVGTADAVNLEASSSGKTLNTLLKQAVITLQIRPANLSYSGKIVGQKVDVAIESAEFIARKDLPVTAAFTGTLQSVPFNATASAGNITEILKADAPLPVRVALQTADLQLEAEGEIARPFENNEFDLKHELTGKEIGVLSPLIDFAVPLHGEFRVKGKLSARGHRLRYEEDLRVGKSDLKAVLTVLLEDPRPKITGSILARELHLDDIKLFEADDDTGAAEDKSRVIPDYTIPVDVFLTADLDLDIKAERILTGIGDLGNLVSKVRLKDGWFKSSLDIAGFTGAQIISDFEINAAVTPPQIKLRLDVEDLDYGILQRKMLNRDLIEGLLDLYVDLSGPGATRRKFLGNADGRITIIGGPGKISGRNVDLWAADLIPTLLSPRWQRQNVTHMNCIVAHVELKEGLAKIDDILLDTRRVTIGGSGILDLDTEELDVFIAPRPKRPSLVRLANVVEIKGTLSEPEVSVARLPRRNWLGRAGMFAGIINPAFLALAFTDLGTGEANPCVLAVEQAREAAEANPQ